MMMNLSDLLKDKDVVNALMAEIKSHHPPLFRLDGPIVPRRQTDGYFVDVLSAEIIEDVLDADFLEGENRPYYTAMTITRRWVSTWE